MTNPSTPAPSGNPTDVNRLRDAIWNGIYACEAGGSRADAAREKARVAMDELLRHARCQSSAPLASEGAGDPSKALNQCDGCAAGMPLRNGDIHFDAATRMPVMLCQAPRYAPASVAPGSDTPLSTHCDHCDRPDLCDIIARGTAPCGRNAGVGPAAVRVIDELRAASPASDTGAPDAWRFRLALKELPLGKWIYLDDDKLLPKIDLDDWEIQPLYRASSLSRPAPTPDDTARMDLIEELVARGHRLQVRIGQWWCQVDVSRASNEPATSSRPTVRQIADAALASTPSPDAGRPEGAQP